MALARKTLNNIRSTVIVVLISSISGSIFSYLLVPDKKIYFAIAGFGVGFIGSIMGSFFEGYIVRLTVFRKINIISHFIFRSLYYLLLFSSLIFIIIFIRYNLMEKINIINVIKDKRFIWSIAFSLVLSLFVNFYTEINRLVGKISLVNFITGRYHNPKNENRFFMFLDINSSTSIAEKIGNKKFLQFLNDFFYDISFAVIESKGEIYKYVGDEIIVTWKYKNGIKKHNIINCILEIKKIVDRKKNLYEKKYGFIPYFKSGFHFGEVVIGEMGDIKKEIVFLGDIVNTTARIQEKCKELKKDVLFSDDVVKLIKNSHFKFDYHGEFILRGKEEKVGLYSIEK